MHREVLKVARKRPHRSRESQAKRGAEILRSFEQDIPAPLRKYRRNVETWKQAKLYARLPVELKAWIEEQAQALDLRGGVTSFVEMTFEVVRKYPAVMRVIVRELRQAEVEQANQWKKGRWAA